MDIANVYEINFAEEIGGFRRLHGVTGGPLSGGTWLDHSPFFAQMAPPGIRLHDAMWPGTVVDLHHIFPDFAKDPQDPANYVFADTDRYLQAVVRTGSEILYRLGHSAGDFGYGNGWPDRGQRPGDLRPGDFDKWVAICLGVIRHYNDGWAGGFRYGIRKWEVWNEANAKWWWNGSPQEFYDLYERFARAAKAEWPGLEVGGFGWVSPDTTTNAEQVAAMEAFVDGFLTHCASRKVPLDFVTWHSYFAWPETALTRSRQLREKLQASGLANVADYLGEWSITSILETDYAYLFDPAGDPGRRRISFDARHGAPGAAGAACVLSLLQDSETSAAYYYSADVNPFGMFDVYGAPHKNFFAMKAMHMLCSCRSRVATRYRESLICPTDKFDQTVKVNHSGVRGLTVLAGIKEGKRAEVILISNYNNPCMEYHLRIKGINGKRGVRSLLLDRAHNLDIVAENPLPGDGMLRVCVPPATVLLLELNAQNEEKI